MSQSVQSALPKSDAKKRNELLFKTLRRRICFLYYNPGEKLSEEALAKEFSVSRTPIRWALNRLEAFHLVTTYHGSGTYVTSMSLDDLHQTYQLRIALFDTISAIQPADKLYISTAYKKKLTHILEKVQAEKRFDKEVVSSYFTMIYDAVMGPIDNAFLKDMCEKLYYHSIRIWIRYLPDTEAEAEFFSLKTELESMVSLCELGDYSAILALRKTGLMINYRKLTAWASEAS